MQSDQKTGAYWLAGPGGAPVAALAPLSGVTDIAMRRIAMRFGAGYVVSEMVASDAFVTGDEEARLRAEGEGVSPHIVQIAGCQPGWMAEAARLAEASGADGIDINMGCPAKRVTGGWSGSALMRDLDHAVTLITAVVAATSLPVTLKMRLGWDHDCLNAPELARRAEAEGVAGLVVHGRTRQQFYKGRADWPAIRAVVEATALPVIANGDIASTGDATACLSASGAAGVMIGRAAMGRPWLVGRIAGELATGRPVPQPSLAERFAAVAEHYDSLLATMGRATGLRHARKHLLAYLDDAAETAGARIPRLRAEVATGDDPAAVLAAMGEAFGVAVPPAIPGRRAA